MRGFLATTLLLFDTPTRVLRLPAPTPLDAQDLELRLFARRHAFAGYTRVVPSHLRSGSRDGSDARFEGSLSCPLAPAGSGGGVSVCESGGIGGDEGDGGSGQGDGSSGGGGRGGSGETESGGLVATRHHAVDWNYIGRARPRPNKWRVEMGPGGNTWREWGFAKVGGGCRLCEARRGRYRGLARLFRSR